MWNIENIHEESPADNETLSHVGLVASILYHYVTMAVTLSLAILPHLVMAATLIIPKIILFYGVTAP